MRGTARFLMKTEELAASFYRKAADRFPEEKRVASFLREMAEDEEVHLRFMSRAVDFIAGNDLKLDEQILLDRAAREGIQRPFLEAIDRLHQGTLTLQDVLECIAVTEFSEWNLFFVYVVNTLKRMEKEFQHAADHMETHKQQVEEFLVSVERADGKAATRLKQLRQVSRIWNKRFLIVEDSEEIAYLLQAVLEMEGDVDVAGNGEQGLKKIRTGHYNVILSDVRMPVMNGVEMYRRAVEAEPEIRRRFLFMTGHLTQDLREFFRENGLRVLQKPAGINEIRNAVREILSERIPDSR